MTPPDFAVNGALPPDEQGYLLRERVSVQWQAFLSALSDEMQSQLNPDEYRELLRSIGVRMGQQLPLGTTDTLEGLEQDINACLGDMRWGLARFSDSGATLVIDHVWSPLGAALHVDNGVAAGLLEGLYEAWFRAAGADASLTVRENRSVGSATHIQLLFGRHA